MNNKSEELAVKVQIELNKRADQDLLEICDIILKMGYRPAARKETDKNA